MAKANTTSGSLQRGVKKAHKPKHPPRIKGGLYNHLYGQDQKVARRLARCLQYLKGQRKSSTGMAVAKCRSINLQGFDLRHPVVVNLLHMLFVELAAKGPNSIRTLNLKGAILPVGSWHQVCRVIAETDSLKRVNICGVTVDGMLPDSAPLQDALEFRPRRQTIKTFLGAQDILAVEPVTLADVVASDESDESTVMEVSSGRSSPESVVAEPGSPAYALALHDRLECLRAYMNAEDKLPDACDQRWSALELP